MIKNNLNGSEIKEIRKSLGLTQREFAEQLGITHNYLSDVENEKKTPSDMLINLINRYNAEINKGDINPDDINLSFIEEDSSVSADLDTYKDLVASQKKTIALLEAEISRLRKYIDRAQIRKEDSPENKETILKKRII